MGVLKSYWGISSSEKNKFLHPFPAGMTGMHMSTDKLQKLLFDRISSNKDINCIEDNIPSDIVGMIDSDHVIVASGAPAFLDDSYAENNLPLNSCFVRQCEWADARVFAHTEAIARPYGWIFMIPLMNRCSVGYLYNKNFNNLKEVKKDLNAVIKEHGLSPYEENHLDFKNYYKKENYSKDGRVAYVGNASCFAEPMEATSLEYANFCSFRAIEMFISEDFNSPSGNKSELISHNNKLYHRNIHETEAILNLHYLENSFYDTAFWRHAKEQAEQVYKEFLQDPNLLSMRRLFLIVNRETNRGRKVKNHINATNASETLLVPNATSQNTPITRGTWFWTTNSFQYHVEKLGLTKSLQRLLKNTQ